MTPKKKARDLENNNELLLRINQLKTHLTKNIGNEDFEKGKAHILFVDDDKVICKLAMDLLTDLGYRVTVFGDGRQAVEYYSIHWREIDLVILDMVMPEMNGKEAFSLMQDTNRDIRALLTSGYTIDIEVQNLLDKGAKGFIQKPFKMSILSQKIAEILEIPDKLST